MKKLFLAVMLVAVMGSLAGCHWHHFHRHCYQRHC